MKLFHFFSLLLVFFVVSSCNSEKRQIKFALEEIESQIDTFTLYGSKLSYSTGSLTIDSLSFDRPFRMRYVYNDKANSGFSVFKVVDGVIDTKPLVLATESENGALYITDRWQNVTLKVVTGGAWALSFEEYGKDFSPVVSPKVDSTSYVTALDYLLNTAFMEFKATDTLISYADLIPMTQHWRILDHRKGRGEFETDWFYLPSCSVRIQAAFDPVEYSSGCSITLEGKTRSESWTAMDVGMYDWKRIHSVDKVFTIPSGQYFIYADGEGLWEYMVSVCY